jgi:hypothetical protein
MAHRPRAARRAPAVRHSVAPGRHFAGGSVPAFVRPWRTRSDFAGNLRRRAFVRARAAPQHFARMRCLRLHSPSSAALRVFEPEPRGPLTRREGAKIQCPTFVDGGDADDAGQT